MRRKLLLTLVITALGCVSTVMILILVGQGEHHERTPLSPRQLSEAAFRALDYPVGVRMTGPIVDSRETVVFVAHRSGRTEDGRPISGPPFAIVRLDARSGEARSHDPVGADSNLRELFPPGAAVLEDRVVKGTTDAERRAAHEVIGRLEQRVMQLYARGDALTDDEQRDVRSYAAAFWKVRWAYELAAYESIGAAFLTWLASCGGARDS